jgi:hypothetical protein
MRGNKKWKTAPSDLLSNLQDTETLASFLPDPHWAVACLLGIRLIRSSSSSCPPFENQKDAWVSSMIRPRSYRFQSSLPALAGLQLFLPALAGLQSAACPRGPATRSESLNLRNRTTLTLLLLLGSEPYNLKTFLRPLGTVPPSVLLPMTVRVQEHQTTPSKSLKYRYLTASEFVVRTRAILPNLKLKSRGFG